jgi:hypothetical protein
MRVAAAVPDVGVIGLFDARGNPMKASGMALLFDGAGRFIRNLAGPFTDTIAVAPA